MEERVDESIYELKNGTWWQLSQTLNPEPHPPGGIKHKTLSLLVQLASLRKPVFRSLSRMLVRWTRII